MSNYYELEEIEELEKEIKFLRQLIADFVSENGLNQQFILIRREDSHFNEAKRSKWEMNRLNYILLKII